MYLPFTFTNERSMEVFRESEQYLREQSRVSEEIERLSWIYHEVGDVIPHTHENLWSGHFFPFIESWEELQISFVLCMFGLYKQSMMSLRSCLEVGLLSIYWNLNDDGHLVIKRWLRSKQDTPPFGKIWDKLSAHPNFQLFQQHYDIKTRLQAVRNPLHEYVHTRGVLHSNRLGLVKSNCQTFEVEGFNLWYTTYREVVEALVILHLVKYPLGTVKYDFDAKFGLDVPAFGHLAEGVVEKIEQLLGDEVFSAFEPVARKDEHVKEIMEYVEALPDLTEEDLEKQNIEWDMLMIERQGFKWWYGNEMKLIDSARERGIEPNESQLARINSLSEWAEQHDFMNPAWERNNDQSQEP
jgi:hypothetical protein